MTLTADKAADTGPAVTPDVDDARTAVLAERTKLADWLTRLEEAQSELAAADDTAGVDLLDNPGSEVELAGQFAQIRERVVLIEKAIAAQRPRVLLAESRYLAAQTVAHEALAEATAAALDAHEAKTERLLAALEKHEGKYLAEAQVIQSQFGSGDLIVGGVSWKEPKSHPLRRAAFQARLHVEVLREMAAGGDPAALRGQPQWQPPKYFADNQTLSLYPDCVKGPDALVHAPAYARSVQHLRARIAELEGLVNRLPAEIADWERRLAAARAAGEVDDKGHFTREIAPGDPSVVNAGRGLDEPGVSQAGLERRCARLETVEDELIEARRVLAELTGGTADEGEPVASS